MGWKRSSLEIFARLYGLGAPGIAEPPPEPRSIFVLRNNDIGDLLAVTPLFEALKRNFPRTKITAGVGSWNFDVLKNNPFVDEVLPVNAPWHNGRVQPQGLVPAMRHLFFSDEIETLRQRKFDIGIDVLGSPLGALLLMRAGIPFRLGVKGYAGNSGTAQRCVTFDPDEHVGRSALRFAALLGAAVFPENRPQIYLDKMPAPSGRIVIAPGGGFAEKCWPAESYVGLVRLLSDFKITVIGGAQDAALGKAMADAGTDVEDFTGRDGLCKTFENIAAARLVVCNCSMAMHAAAAFRIPAFVLLGEYLPSASQHARQWSYDNCINLGKGDGRGRIFTPAEANDLIRLSLDSATETVLRKIPESGA